MPAAFYVSSFDCRTNYPSSDVFPSVPCDINSRMLVSYLFKTCFDEVDQMCMLNQLVRSL